MRKSKSKRATNQSDTKLVLPKWKSEAEEAKWWYENRNLVFEMLSKQGKLVGPRVVEKTHPVTLRIPESDLEKAKSIAESTGKPYQRVLKDAMREGLAKPKAFKAGGG